MNSTIKTVIRAYSFDITKPEEKTAWDELRARLSADGMPHCHGPVISEVWSHYRALDGQTLELETRHLFENQWNTAPIPNAESRGAAEKGLRVFDWALESIWTHGRENRAIKRGHYLEQTQEMRAIRDNTNACGYCGKQESAARGSVFCPNCLDSEYLQEKDLHLLRMRAVSENRPDNSRPELTEAERAHLLPLFHAAQIHGTTERNKVRIARRRADIKAKFENVTRNALVEHDGLLWLLDRGITQEPIFYTHTGRFGFGWRQPLDAATVSALLEAMGAEFPFPYDIKCADGRELSGN